MMFHWVRQQTWPVSVGYFDGYCGVADVDSCGVETGGSWLPMRWACPGKRRGCNGAEHRGCSYDRTACHQKIIRHVHYHKDLPFDHEWFKPSERLRFVRSLSKAMHTHLSKRPSDFNQNGSVLLQALAQKKHLLNGWNSLTAIRSFHSMVFKANTRNKTERKGYWKLCQKMVSFLAYHFVWGHLGVLKDVPFEFTMQAWIMTPTTLCSDCKKIASGHLSVVCRVPYPIVCWVSTLDK